MKFAILIIFAYLLGSIPFGLIIARLHHIDLFKVGSGNIGATNLSRALGKKWAYLCFLLDVLKGAVPV
nr:glycerol-3-phosphate acyltransferase [Planctomycetota bacterium]